MAVVFGDPTGPAALRRPRRGGSMAIGPVQLLVLGFEKPEFSGEIVAELQRLRDSDMVRVIDALAVHKDADGDITTLTMSNLTLDERIELGAKIGALIGLGALGDSDEVVEIAKTGAEVAAEEGIHVFNEDEVWDVLEEIPPETAAALVLLEHHWAVPLRDAIARANGFRISDGFISPFDLVAIGMVTAAEAKELALAGGSE
jgi:uncharacterized membrane protein